MQSAVLTQDTYFRGKRLVPLDRLGSATKIGYTGVSFYPYGEDKGTAGPNDNWKFATYLRDSATGLDYAMNRYYSSGIGRFLSPDPYVNSSGPADPQSWNRYSYGRNDPTDRYDPLGLCDQSADTAYSVTVCGGSYPGMVNLGSGLPTVGYQANPSPLTRQQSWLLAKSWQKKVASGAVTDCQALAGFAQNAADNSHTNSQFVSDFGALVPMQFGVGATLTWWSSSAVVLNSASDPQASGYAQQYQNTVPDNLATGWNGDKGHHFSALFEFGYLHGIGFGAIATFVLEYYEAQATGGGVVNQGDVSLGIQAALLGYELAINAISPGEVAASIANTLCNH